MGPYKNGIEWNNVWMIVNKLNKGYFIQCHTEVQGGSTENQAHSYLNLAYNFFNSPSFGQNCLQIFNAILVMPYRVSHVALTDFEALFCL